MDQASYPNLNSKILLVLYNIACLCGLPSLRARSIRPIYLWPLYGPWPEPAKGSAAGSRAALIITIFRTRAATIIRLQLNNRLLK